MPGKQAKVVTPPMLKRMLRHVSHSSFPARDRAMILLSTKAGLRACEIAGLDWSMVLDAAGSRVRHDPRPRHHREEAPAAGGFRCTPICAGRSRSSADHEPVGPGDPLLSRRAPEGEQRRQLVRRPVQELGFEGCSSHSGRRSFITMAARNIHRSGCSLRDVQLLAGHSSIETTEGYIDGDTCAQRKLVGLL